MSQQVTVQPAQAIQPQPVQVQQQPGAGGVSVSNVSQFPRNTTQITQANIATQPIRVPDVIHRLSFSSETVKRLTSDDFEINTKELIASKNDDCMLVLFYTENTESYQIANIWAIVAQQVAGPVFGAINMLSERKVAEAFTRLRSDGSHPLHWAGLRQYPFILVYRKKWPVAVYNGPREVQALIDYSLTRACEAAYYEPLQLGGSMQGEARLEMGPYDVYANIPGQPPRVRTESLQYNAEEPIRGFNPNIPIVATGTPSAQRATAAIRSEEVQQQQAANEGVISSLSQTEEAAPTLQQLTGETAQGLPPPTTTPGAVPQPATVTQVQAPPATIPVTAAQIPLPASP